MPANGTATVNFGAFPGKTDASVAVTGQGAIAADSEVEAWGLPLAATAEHSADEQMVEEVKFVARSITPGTGFTIYGLATGRRCVYGNFNVGWAWA